MKSKGLLFISFLCAFLLFIGCSGKEPTLSVPSSTYTLKINQSVTVEPTIGETDKQLNLLWESDTPEVAGVDNSGKITGKAIGTAIVTVTLKDYPDVFQKITVSVDGTILTLSGEDTVYVGSTVQLTATDALSTDNKVLWKSSDTTILTVDQNGLIIGVKEGTARVQITSKVSAAEKLEKEIKVETPAPESIDINDIDLTKVTLSKKVRLKATVFPETAPQNVVWTSSNEKVATVNETGLITPVWKGEVTITATAEGTDISVQVTFTVNPTPMELISLTHVTDPSITYDVMFWGSDNPNENARYNVFGSVTNFYYGPWSIDTKNYLLSSKADNYSGETIDKVEFIVVHDTASALGGAIANAGWMLNPSNDSTSWHYTVGNDGVIQSLPLNIVGWHAGDGLRSWSLTDTNVKAVNPNDPVQVTITDGYWTFDGIKSELSAPLVSGRTPTNADLARNGIYAEVGENGNYFIGTTYVHSSNIICNTGGGANGIGIETAMNNGSDIYLTWHYAAKLVAKLMIDFNLQLNRVKQHNNFSNKDCPRTMRNAGLWPNFLKMVQAEYLIQSELQGYTFEFTSLDKQYVSDTGRIIKLPDIETTVFYTVTITGPNNYSETQTFSSVLPAKRA